MAQSKNIVLRKQIEEVLYDLMVKTITDQVYNSDSSKNLTTMLSEINASIAAKANDSDLTELETKVNNLVTGAPEAYDTLLEISQYIETHQDEYEALLAISNNKVDKVPGKQLSTEDFTTELKTKLEALMDNATLQEKISSLETRVGALETGGSVDPEDLDASMIAYTNASKPNVTTVKDALDDLMYFDLTINLSSTSATQQEKGVSLASVVLNWTYNKDVVSQTINSVSIPDVEQRTYTVEGPFTENTTFTLKANDGKKDFTKSLTISFLNNVYWGVGTVTESGSVNNEFVLGLSGSKFAASKNAVGTITANAEAGNYIYYAQPASWADPVFNIGGFDTEFELLHTFTLTNASGHEEQYKVFKSGQAGLGSTSMVVK